MASIVARCVVDGRPGIWSQNDHSDRQTAGLANPSRTHPDALTSGAEESRFTILTYLRPLAIIREQGIAL